MNLREFLTFTEFRNVTLYKISENYFVRTKQKSLLGYEVTHIKNIPVIWLDCEIEKLQFDIGLSGGLVVQIVEIFFKVQNYDE